VVLFIIELVLVVTTVFTPGVFHFIYPFFDKSIPSAVR
jgi:hypothetical protein